MPISLAHFSTSNVSTLFGHEVGIAPFHIDLIPFELSFSLLWLILLFGLMCGLISAFFLNSIDFFTPKIRISDWKKIMIAGGITALFSTLSPETIGLGYQLLALFHFAVITTTTT
ncbi:chloride channel protein [Psychromonas hadalis]|uniref:chloride channel protein n=1 Tax=Psychromonas hadalis TaxID=211669 RepID=UPI0003B5926A|nr:chloride channel protein [Psychromonas hadalis]